MKKHIPNTITLLNLICGVIAVYEASHNNLSMAAFFIFLGAGFDFLDGAIARLLKVSSPLGVQLDSMADMVTFGTAPAFIAYQLLMEQTDSIYLAAIALLIPAFSALRLAKFNIDERQHSSFIGLPTPANGFFWAGLVFIDNTFIESPYLLMGLVVFMSYIMVAELPMFSLKFANLGLAENKVRYIFLILCILLIVFLYFTAIPIIVFLYIVFSIFNNLVSKKNEIQS